MDCCDAWLRVGCCRVCRKAQRLRVSEKPAAAAALAATCNMQHTTCNIPHATCNIQGATYSMQRATYNVQRDRSTNCTAIAIAVACSAALHGPEVQCYHCMQPLRCHATVRCTDEAAGFDGRMGLRRRLSHLPIEAPLEEQHFECAVTRWLRMGDAARLRYGAQQVTCRVSEYTSMP